MSSETIALNLGDSPLWVPFKSLYNVVNNVVVHKDIQALPDLEIVLKAHKPDFICLLKNPVRNATHREIVKKASVSGISIIGQQRPQILSQQLVDEALIISDMFNLNELTSLELLIAGQQQQPHFPGLTRGLVAMLLYYDGRRSLVSSLRSLVQASEGRSWTLGLTPEITSFITNYTNQLKEEGLVVKIIDLIESMDVTKELELLLKNRALGGPRYRKQVKDLIMEIKQSLAEVIFCWACQNTLSEVEVVRLLCYLSQQNGVLAEGIMEETAITLSMAFLYVIDVSCLQTCDEQDPIIKKLNLICTPELVDTIHKKLTDTQMEWKLPSLRSLFQFAWSVSLRTLAQFSQTLAINHNERLEDDERIFEAAIDGGAFKALNDLIIKNEIFHQEEFFLKRIHNLITDFIVLMPVKVKDMRNRGDESAKIISAYIQEGIEPPTNLPLHFQHFLTLIANIYENNPLNLDLALDYWCQTDNYMEQSYSIRPSQRQVALFKFVRVAGDLLPAPLFVPYHKMLTSLASSKLCAHHCFNLLKLNGQNVVGGHYCIVSWDHFFSTLHNYYNNLREEFAMAPGTGITYRQKMLTKGITQQEVEGLCAVLDLIAEIVELDEVARLTLAENTHYSPLNVLFGLISCSISSVLKASLIRCLAAFGSSHEIAMNIWQGLYNTQIIPTVQSTAVYHPSGILTELEDVESRKEEYPVTLSVLKLIDTLLSNCKIITVANAPGLPGLKAFVEFIQNKIFLKSHARIYKNLKEKYQILTLCLQIFQKVLQTYHVKNNWSSKANLTSLMDFHPGSYILSEMLRDGRMLRTILYILDEGVRSLDPYISFNGQKEMEESILKALSLLYYCLIKQDEFMQQVRETNCDLLVTSLDTLLMGINPRTGEADHFHNIMKYITYNTFIPEHSLWSLRILYKLCSMSQIAQHLISVFNADPIENDILLHGFVEVLEVDISGEVEENESSKDEEDSTSQVRNKSRIHLLMLLLNCLKLPGPNIAHFLLGFNVRKPINQTEIHEPGIMGSRRTCLHAVLALLDSGASTEPANIFKCPKMAGLAYQLIYMLCSNVDTSGPVLRYLRSTHDFFYRHLQFLPYKNIDNCNPKFMLIQSWLLKALAIELRVTSAHHQRSHVQRLLQLLLEDKPLVETASNGAGIVEPMVGMSNMSSYSFIQPTIAPLRRKLMQILDNLDFAQIILSLPQLEYFDINELPQVFESCIALEPSGLKLINVKELSYILKSEISTLQNSSGFGQRSFIIQQEMSQVLDYADKNNKSRIAVFSKQEAFNAWRQVVEIILIACPLDVISREKEHQFVLEVSQELIRRVISVDFLPELMPAASGVILTLMSTLRHSIMSPVSHKLPYLNSESANISSMVPNFSSQTSTVSIIHHSSLLIVLKAIVECLLQIGGGLQRVRANFYAALLNVLNIVQKPYDFQSHTSAGIESVVFDQDSETLKLRMEFMDTILSFGEIIMEVICRDACNGHDITKMLSFTVLDVMISLDTQQQWLSYLVSKGYLLHILGSLKQDDDQLQNLFNRNGQNPSHFRIFYVFESKMALLTRISNSNAGALSLLRNGILGKLAECEILNLRPNEYLSEEMKKGNVALTLSELLKCYRQILSSIMKLILSITTALGLQHRDVTLQILGYVSHNMDFFLNILRNRSLLNNVEGLEELSLITAVLARTSLDDPDKITEDTLLLENRGQFLLLRQHLLMMLPCLEINENLASSELRLSNNDAKMRLTRLRIASHILDMCCSNVSESGSSVSNCRILFGPSLNDTSLSASSFLVQDIAITRPLSSSRLPNISLLVSLILQYSSQLPNIIENHNLLSLRLQSLPTLTSDELSEFLPNDVKNQSTAVQHLQKRPQDLVRESLLDLLQYRAQEIEILSYMLECSAYILLRHLEYFAEASKTINPWHHPQERNTSIRPLYEVRSSGPSSENETLVDLPFNRQELENFITEVTSIFTDAFFHKLQVAQQHLGKGRSHVSFFEAIVCRIKRLVKLKLK